MISLASKTTKVLYQKGAKPFLFRHDPEDVHDTTVALGKRAGAFAPARWLMQKSWAYDNPMLYQRIHGIDFNNPIGLAAGFDKNAELIQFLPTLGFGHAEVGSITQHPCEGNPKPRLWRMPKSKSILVYYGLKNNGVDALAPRIASYQARIPIGTSIAKTNQKACKNDAAAIADYVYSFTKLAAIGDYFTINISCPNAYGGQPFTDKKRLHALLSALDPIPTDKPVFIKLSPNLTKKERQAIALLATKHRVHGFICSNLNKDHNNTKTKEPIPSDVGGMSGKLVNDLSNTLIADMYSLTKGQKTIIGCGGIFNAGDAYQKILLGASLLQMISGLIFEGPQVVGQINKGLVRELHKDGFSHIGQAVGTKHNS